MRNMHLVVGLLAGTIVASAGVAEAGTIRAAVGAVNTGGDAGPSYDIGNTIDQSGLSAGYVSGVTDFDTYIGSGPVHTIIAAGFEWFSASGVHAATITYDLGSIYDVRRLALWVDEYSGIDTMDVFTSTDGVGYTHVGGLFAPTDNVGGSTYPAEVFVLAPSLGRYVKLDVTGPQLPHEGWDGIGMGEIAFDTATAASVPLPSAAWMGLGLLGVVGIAARRRRTHPAA